jgi:hypothetical protein
MQHLSMASGATPVAHKTNNMIVDEEEEEE